MCSSYLIRVKFLFPHIKHLYFLCCFIFFHFGSDSSEDNTSDFSEDETEHNDSSKEEEIQSSTESIPLSEEEVLEDEKEIFTPEVENYPSSDKLEELEDEIERIYEVSDALENDYKLSLKTLSKHEESLKKLSTYFSETKNETAKIKAHVQTLVSAENDIDSTDTCEDLIDTLKCWIKRETNERINYQKQIEEQFSEIEREIEIEKSKMSKLKLSNSIKTLSNDPEVAVNAKTMIKNKHDRNELTL